MFLMWTELITLFLTEDKPIAFGLLKYFAYFNITWFIIEELSNFSFEILPFSLLYRFFIFFFWCSSLIV